MSNYGQQPPYGQTPYGPQSPYGQPQPPYQRPAQAPYGQPQGQPYPGQPNPYGPPQPGAAAQGQPPAGQQGQPYPQSYPPPGQWPGQAPQLSRPTLVERSLVVVTMDAVPGRTVTGVVGEVVGVVARSRELPPALRTANPLDGYAVMLTRSRQEAVDRLVEMAEAAGADAVVGLRYDCSEITQSLSEVSAYGTAVRLDVAEESGAASPATESRWGDEDAETPVQPLTPPDFVGTPDFSRSGFSEASGSETPGSGSQSQESQGSESPGSDEGDQPQNRPAAPGAHPWPSPQWPGQS